MAHVRRRLPSSLLIRFYSLKCTAPRRPPATAGVRRHLRASSAGQDWSPDTAGRREPHHGGAWPRCDQGGGRKPPLGEGAFAGDDEVSAPNAADAAAGDGPPELQKGGKGPGRWPWFGGGDHAVGGPEIHRRLQRNAYQFVW
ncbi:hypothetical protein PVAP13_5NG406240 [Panicum virgatum]|uniref:Uncharacterized protein n=1 Tax=Panicum virgatum TaxID=38727 RepID=A0A8T0RX21_PANVG|nr:hypothetical protein PVAP13_5NG406240 [Panicum virgatum]